MENKLFSFMLIVFFALIVSCSFIWNILTLETNKLNLVNSVGKAFFKEIVTTRLWNARHGGVYVPISEDTKPNPYLKVAHRDITTVKGLELTLVNPAFMTRQIAEIAEIENEIRYHITSTKPIRPKNRADDWETKALALFESGSSELTEYIEDSHVFRHMEPLIVKQACLKCHAEQGYRIGDIRGGISITLPAGVYIDAAKKSKTTLMVLHALFLIIGIIVLLLFRKIRFRYIETLNKKNRDLKEEMANRIHAEKEKEHKIVELKKALEQISTLNGLLPICANCKKIRDDKGYWNQLESYIEQRSDAQFSHGICPECAEELYGNQNWFKKMK